MKTNPIINIYISTLSTKQTMKTYLHYFLLLLTVCTASSCSYTVFQMSDLKHNYDQKMTTAEEVKAKNSIPIYHSEKDIPKDFKIIAYVRYTPFPAIPIIAPESRQQLKKFYKKAVLKTKELGGDAVLVCNIGNFKVLSLSDKVQTADGEEKESASYGTSFSSDVFERFDNGSVYKLEPKQQSKYASKLTKEIKDNIDNCKTLEDVDFVSKEIDALKKYYETIGKLNKSKQEKIEDFQDDLQDVKKKIEKKLARAAKKAAKKAESEAKQSTE